MYSNKFLHCQCIINYILELKCDLQDTDDVRQHLLAERKKNKDMLKETYAHMNGMAWY